MHSILCISLKYCQRKQKLKTFNFDRLIGYYQKLVWCHFYWKFTLRVARSNFSIEIKIPRKQYLPEKESNECLTNTKFTVQNSAANSWMKFLPNFNDLDHNRKDQITPLLSIRWSQILFAFILELNLSTLNNFDVNKDFGIPVPK